MTCHDRADLTQQNADTLQASAQSLLDEQKNQALAIADNLSVHTAITALMVGAASDVADCKGSEYKTLN